MAIGVVAIAWPAITLQTLVMIIGIFLIVEGIMHAVILGRFSQGANSLALLPGIAGIVVGILFFVLPEISLRVLLVIVGVWAVLLGGAELVAAFYRRKTVPIPVIYLIPAALAVVIGIVLLALPAAGTAIIAVVFGIAAIARGVALLFA